MRPFLFRADLKKQIDGRRFSESDRPMKSNVLRRTAAALAVTFALVTGVIACKDKATPADLQGAVLTAVSGQVTLIKGDTKTTVTADKLYSKEAMLLSGMILETGKDGKVDMQFQTGTQLRVGPSSRIKLENAQVLTGENFSQTLIRIDSGSLYTKVNRLEKGSSFSLITPTATASVRGTDFLTKVEEGESSVLVQDGAVAVTDDEFKKEEVVEGGNKAEVDNASVEVKPLDEEDKKELQEYGSNIQGITEQGRQQINRILQTFEENKAEIMKAIEGQKEANKELIEGQKENNRKLIEGQLESNRQLMEQQKERNREEKEAIESQAKEDVKKNVEGGRQGIEEQKSQKPTNTQSETQSELDRIKQQKPGN